jgi:hypothetical protein
MSVRWDGSRSGGIRHGSIGEELLRVGSELPAGFRRAVCTIPGRLTEGRSTTVETPGSGNLVGLLVDLRCRVSHSVGRVCCLNSSDPSCD